MHRMRFLALMAVAVIAACSDDTITNPAPVVPQAAVVTATGNIAADVDAFRNLLGASNGGTAGEQPGGRREISWDGAGANPFNNKNDFPADFFNTNVKSGAVFTTAGTGFRNDSTLFAEINPNYASQFNFFSATKIFTPANRRRPRFELTVSCSAMWIWPTKRPFSFSQSMALALAPSRRRFGRTRMGFRSSV